MSDGDTREHIATRTGTYYLVVVIDEFVDVIQIKLVHVVHVARG